jgi:hypothetical protein
VSSFSSLVFRFRVSSGLVGGDVDGRHDFGGRGRKDFSEEEEDRFPQTST